MQTFEELSQERKDLQAKGHLPEWYTTQAWQMFKAKYMYEPDALYGRHKTIAKTLASYLPKHMQAYYQERFFEEMWSGRLSPASPTLANVGTNRGLGVSCSGQDIEDSVDSFYGNLHEAAVLSKNAFGTSGNFDNVRGRGTPISKGGVANGVREVIDDYFTMAKKIAQGGNRRGSFAAYISIEHPDWDECIDDLVINTDGKNYGWIIKDSFITKLICGDEDAQRRFTKALHTKLITGKGYFFFIDKANRARPQMYKDLGLDVKATNLCCMTSDQRVVTDKGILTVKELYESRTSNLVVGLDGVSKASPMLLPRPNAPIVQIETAEGYRHKVTPDHRVWKKDYGWIEAQQLVEGDKILTQQIEGLFGNKHNPKLALIMGLIAGDGTYTTHSVCIDLWKYKTLQFSQEIEQAVAELIQHESISTTSTLTPTFAVYGGKARLSSAPLARVLASEGFNKETKLQIPDLVWKGTKETVEHYLRGLYVTDGHIQSSDEVCSLVLASVSKEFLQDIQILWANLGVKTSINKMREGGLKDFGKGGIYNTQPCYRLLITSIQGCQIAEKALRLGEFRSGTAADNYNERLTKQGYAQKLYATFTGLTELPNEDAYCLTVDSDTHAWTVNGLITHNTEIMLHSSEEYTYSCVLASLNLVHWEDIKTHDTISVANVFLDCVVEDFLQTSKDIKGLEKVRAFTEKSRAVGLGVMGFHTLCQMKRIPMDGLEASFLNQEIFTAMQKTSLLASQEMAQVLGEPEWCKGYGVRNTHRLAQAPTKSTGLLMGGVSEGINPDPGMVFEAASAAGELTRIVPVIYELMKERGVYNKDTIKRIIDNLGSVQQETWLTDEEKLVFRTAFEMNQHALLRLASQRQPKLCQGQSINLYIPGEDSEELISDLITECFLNENILSQYYIYSRNGVVVKDECVACQV